MAMMPVLTQPRFTPVEMAEAERRMQRESVLREQRRARHQSRERRHARLRGPAPTPQFAPAT
jgi:hypothetical protein